MNLWWPLLLVGLVAVLFWAGAAFYRRNFDPRSLESRARRAQEQGRADQALALYLRVIRSQAAFERKQLKREEAVRLMHTFRRARLALGHIYQRRGERREAFPHFVAARKLGAKLPAPALALLAEEYAAQNDRSKEAVEVYLEYAAAFPPKQAEDEVYRCLQAACAVQESSDAARCRDAILLNRRLVKIRPEIEWAHYYLGLAQLIEGDFGAATQAFEQARKLNPGRALTYYWLGVCRLQQTPADLDGAIEVLATFLAAPGTNPSLLRRQEVAALQLGYRLVQRAGGFDLGDTPLDERQQADLARAIEYFGYATGKNPDCQEGYFCLGRILSLLGETDKAIQALQTAARLAEKNPPRKPNLGLKHCLYHLAVEQQKAGDFEAAAAALGQATELDQDFLEAHALAAVVNARRADYSRAERHARAGLRLDPSRPSLRACLIEALFRQSRFSEVVAEIEAADGTAFPPEQARLLALAAGRSYLSCGQFEKAAQWLQSAQGEPGSDFYLGCALAHCGRYQEALELFTRAEAEGGALALRARLHRGHVLWHMGKVESAEAHYLAVQEAEPDCADAIHALGSLCAARGELEKAAGYFTRLLDMEPAGARGFYGLARIAEQRGKAEEAILYYQKALDAGAGSLEGKVCLRLGVLYCRTGDVASALDWLEKARDQGQQGDALLFYLGLALLRSGRSAEATELWDELATRHPEDDELAPMLARAHYLAGASYVVREDYARAVVHWESYLKLCPEDTSTAQGLAKLYAVVAFKELKGGGQASVSCAQSLFAKALRWHPADRELHYYYALCDLVLGRHSECRARLEEQLALDDKDPRVLYHLGLCMLRQGALAEAVEKFRQLAQPPYGSIYARRAAALLGDCFAARGRHDLAIQLQAAALGLADIARPE